MKEQNFEEAEEQRKMENTGRLKYSYVRKVLEHACSPEEMKRVLAKLDTSKEARISFEEFLPYV